MNKFKLLVAPLLVLPFVIACNNGGGDKPEGVKFSLSGNPTLDGKVATVNIDWTPTDSIKFESFTFTASPAKENTVTFEQTGDPRPMPVKITFEDDITEDISGTLSFKYEDVTAKTKGESSINVIIPKPEDDPTLTKEEFDKAISFEGVQYLQVEEDVLEDPIEPTTPKSIEMSPNVSHVLINGYSFFEETYCRKYEIDDSIAYDACFKIDPADGFEFGHNVVENLFITPQTYLVGNLGENLADTIKELLGLDYSSFSYIKAEGVYKAKSASGKAILKFEDKKVVSYEIEINGEGKTTGTLGYTENTPAYPIEHNEINIPDLGQTDDFTLYAQEGKMYIDITNATGCLKKDSVLYAAYCNLSDESSISQQTPQVFSSVEASLGETTLDIFYGTESAVIPPSTVINAEYWQASLPDIIPDDTLYIVLTINNDYVSSQTGRTAKQNYTGEVSCTVHNVDDGDDTNTVKIEIDYDSITNQSTL